MNAADDFATDESRAGLRIPPHRILLILIGIALVAAVVVFGRWDWLPDICHALRRGWWSR